MARGPLIHMNHSRRQAMEAVALISTASFITAQGDVLARGLSPLEKKFAEAIDAGNDLDAAIRLWGEAIAMAPDNSAAWSNRGTIFLQAGRWKESREDLTKALELDEAARPGDPDPLLLNNLGNSEGALGNWDRALELYGRAAELNSPEIQAIAGANMSLAYFQTEQEEAAIRGARQLLRRDAQFLDMRAALTAYLWAVGKEKDAEEEWEALQQAEDGLGGEIYSRTTAVARVRNRWPPRCTAALDAFLALSRQGSALGYDGAMQEYQF